MRTYHQEEKKCEVCATLFLGRKGARYCSGRCRMFASRERRAATAVQFGRLTLMVPKHPTPDPFIAHGGLTIVDDTEHIPAGEE